MTRINLLPWREELRSFQNNLFYVQVGLAAGLACLVTLLLHVCTQTILSNTVMNNQYLKNQLTVVEKKIKEIETLQNEKKHLSVRLDIIQALEEERFFMIRLLESLVRVVPPQVSLSQVAQKGKSLSLEGATISNSYIADFIRKLSELPWLLGATVEEIHDGDESGNKKEINLQRTNYKFKLLVNQNGQG